MNTSIIKFDYNGNVIPFEKGSDVMVNLTAMAKAYPDKNLSTIVNSQEISDYCTSLSKLKNFSLADLLIVKRGGDNPGTWAHRLVAIRVAQKLNSDLAVWVDMRVDELLKYGMTATQPTLEQMINNPDLVISLATQLKSEREEKQRIETENLYLKEQNEAQRPAVIFTESVKVKVVRTYLLKTSQNSLLRTDIKSEKSDCTIGLWIMGIWYGTRDGAIQEGNTRTITPQHRGLRK